MKSLTLFLGLFVLVSLSKNTPRLMATEEVQPVHTLKHQSPMVQLFGITQSMINNDFGISFSVNIDIAAGYEIPFAYLFA